MGSSLTGRKYYIEEQPYIVTHCETSFVTVHILSQNFTLHFFPAGFGVILASAMKMQGKW